MNILWLQGIAILLQLVAAVLALRMIRLTGRSVAWIMIAIALTVSVIKRGVAFYVFFRTPMAGTLDFSGHLLEAIIQVVISILFLLGIYLIEPIFVSIRESEKFLLETRSEMEERIRQRTADLSLTNEALRREIERCENVEGQLRQRTTDLEDMNRELEAFNYSVSHDLRGPLTSVEGFSRNLLDHYGNSLDNSAREYVENIQSSAHHMGELIDDLLRLSMASRADMHREEVDLSALATSVIESLQQRIPEREVEVIIESGIIANGDPHLLRIAFENLLGNAWKFTGKSQSPRIEFGIKKLKGKQTFFIKDNGVGFNKEEIEGLFQPFHRLDSTAEFPGTGLGLAIVSRIIHRHGGTIYAEGESGKGATLYFTL